MHMREHTKRHQHLDSELNELVADFVEHSAVPAHLATVQQLLTWSRKQARDANHPNTGERHTAKP